MIERDYSYLKHILEAIEYIEDFSKNVHSADDLKKCPLERAAIERMLTIIGEAAKNISPEIRVEYAGLPWKEIAGMRDKIMHHYFGVDYEAVFETVTHDIPRLKKNILDILYDLE
ncbi:MAG TPA: DUF86 domain-containing protein [Methanoregulaceae archaeon]|jgi:uncharacterized protein with HEPN domain|nr:DUF86 domain-containing protein [Methanoregulaceae archaeon]